MSFFKRTKNKDSEQNFADSEQRGEHSTFRVDATSLKKISESDKYSDDGVIKQIADFPPHQDVLTHPQSTNISLRVPVDLQDKILAIKLDPTRARIVFDPAENDAVEPYFAVIQTALGSIGISVLTPHLRAEKSVIRSVRLNSEKKATTTSGLGNKSDGANLFREWVQIAKNERATDLHIRVLDGGQSEVTMRVDGELEPITGSYRGLFTSRDALNAMKSAYEVFSDRHSNNHGTFSETSTLSSMIDSALGIPNLRLRFASLRGLYGPKAVIRLLPSNVNEKCMSFQDMGFAPSHIDMFERAQRLDAGAIAQMGVTGSGKTTAAKTFVETHPKYGSSAMYQVADPIEYPIYHMHQIYVHRNLMVLNESGKKDVYSEAIESLLRSDPDFVDVGEVRDVLSARAMANIAKSGHVSMFTLHVDSVSGTINRLTDPKIGLTRSELTSGNLIGLLCYQALVPILCPHCKLPQHEVSHALRKINTEKSLQEDRYITYLCGVFSEKLGIDASILRWKNPEGCEHCKKRGAKGLTICAEILMPDDDWLDLSAANKDREAIRVWRKNYSDKQFTSENMNGKLVMEHAIYKAYKGLIDPRSVERFGQISSLEVFK